MNGVSEEFSRKVTRVSFLMSVFVIYIHANNLAYYGISPEKFCIPSLVVRIGGVLGGIAVPFFFMLSAYWLFRFNVFDDDATKKLHSKLKRKVKTIVAPYLLWNTFGMLFYMVITRIPVIANMLNNEGKIEITVSNVIGGIFFHKYYFTFWYLQDLIVLMALSPILLEILKDKKKITSLMIATMIANLFQIDFIILRGTSIVFFLMGAYMAVYERSFFENRESGERKYIFLFVLIVATGIVRYFDIPVMSKLAVYITPILLWKAADALKLAEQHDKKCNWFTTQSFFVYASHIIPVTVIGHVLAKVGSGYAWATLSYLIAPWITLGLIYIVANILHKYMPQFYNLVCGGRS